MESAASSRLKRHTTTVKQKKKVVIAEGSPNVRLYEVNNTASNGAAAEPKAKEIKGSLRTRDPRPAPAPDLIDLKSQPKPVRKALKKTLKWRAARAIHAKVLADVEHNLLKNNNADDDMCHIIRMFAAIGNYTYKKTDTPFHIRALLIRKYKRALGEDNFRMLQGFNAYLHQKLTGDQSNSDGSNSNA